MKADTAYDVIDVLKAQAKKADSKLIQARSLRVRLRELDYLIEREIGDAPREARDPEEHSIIQEEEASHGTIERSFFTLRLRRDRVVYKLLALANSEN